MGTGHAVVCGASFAGLLAARVLSDAYGSVSVIERDPLTADISHRRGVSQGYHLHQMLSAGVRLLVDLFPGILDELEAAGAIVMRHPGRPDEFHLGVGDVVFSKTGRFTRSEDMLICLASRPLLEGIVRERIRAIANVTLVDRHEVAEPVIDASGLVTGVRIAERDTGRERILSGDVVVDATGRAGRIPAFLTARGFPRPDERRYDVGLSYSSQLFRLRPGSVAEKVVLDIPTLARPEGIGMMAYEDDTAIVTVIGLAGRTTPTTLPGLLDSATRFAPARVAAALRAAEPVGRLSVQRYPASVWRRYDRLRRFPRNLVVVGDAVCSFNPVYGQGMTSAALQAVSLRRTLHDGIDDPGPQFFRTAAAALSPIWWSNRVLDYAIIPPESGPSALQRVIDAGMDKVYAAAGADVAVAETVYRQMQLLGRPTDLLRPSMLKRVVAGNRRSG